MIWLLIVISVLSKNVIMYLVRLQNIMQLFSFHYCLSIYKFKWKYVVIFQNCKSQVRIMGAVLVGNVSVPLSTQDLRVIVD